MFEGVGDGRGTDDVDESLWVVSRPGPLAVAFLGTSTTWGGNMGKPVRLDRPSVISELGGPRGGV